MQGIVKMFNQEKGFGFITTNEGKDIFFHFSQLVVEGYKTIKEGQAVEFELVHSDRGPVAHNIIRI